MSFQYGSDIQEIKNPFKPEGMLYIAGGAVVLIVGFISLLTLRTQILGSGKWTGWLNLLICVVLLSLGCQHIGKGLFKIFRFYVGRGVPTSLGPNVARSEKHAVESTIAYSDEDLDQMIGGRKNITFHAPRTLFDRMVYSIFPNLIFLPYPMRNGLHVLVQNTGYSVIALLAYLLSYLSGFVGLTSLTKNNINGWLGFTLAVFLLVIWLANPLSVKRVSAKHLLLGRNTNLVWVILAALLIPALGEVAARNGLQIPQCPFHPALYVVLYFVLIPILVTVGILLAKIRVELYEPLTEVSEFREHWQENVHPKDFFRSLDMELANLRYKEFPNRVYRELNPNLKMEGSMDKGSFEGDTILETQPIYEQIPLPYSLRQIRLYSAVAGHTLVALSAILLFVMNQYKDVINVSTGINGFYIPVLMWIVGTSAITLAHLYWAEIHFTSYLIQFHGEGTYTESKLSVGMAITDSIRSENTMVRSSFSPWLLVTKVLCSTLANSSGGNLAGPRFIMSMHKADSMMDHLVAKIKQFLNNRQAIAVSVSEKDMQSIQTIYSINEAAPSKETFLNGANQQDTGKLKNSDGNNEDNSL